MSRTRVLLWGDYGCSTGYAKVMSNIAQFLQKTKEYHIDVIGINYDGSPLDSRLWPGNVWPALSALRMQGPYADPHGRQVVLDFLSTSNYDLLIFQNDAAVILPVAQQIKEIASQKNITTIYYHPLDAPPKKEWVEQCIDLFDYPVNFSEYGRDEVLKVNPESKIMNIFLGTETRDFYPLTPEVKKLAKAELFPTLSDRFIITNVNRNSGRKDTARSFMILKELRDRGYQRPFLYMHMQETDFGGSLFEQARTLGLELDRDWTMPNPQQFSSHTGFPIEVLNKVYNASDCYLTCTHGEGWGLTMPEAMATRLPVVAPRNTSVTEILGEDRGYLVPSGDSPTRWIIRENDSTRLRPLMNVEKAADAIIEIMENPDVAQKKCELALEWVQKHTWNDFRREWAKILDEAKN